VETNGEWRWLGSMLRTNSAGFFSRTVQLGAGSLVRVWSSQAQAYGWPLFVR
jgi:hypothetical protein